MRRLATLALAASLALPAVAHAQGGAGDDQYQDPFGNSGSSGSGSGSGGGGSNQSNPPPLSSAPPAASAPAPAPAPAPAAAATTAQGAQLAATGADPLLVALLGSGLVMGGAGLRLRLRRVD
jgi:hypothetical protein